MSYCAGTRLEPSDGEFKRAANRGLEDAEHDNDAHCFVTSNYLDFSTPKGNRREPHPDLTSPSSAQLTSTAWTVWTLHL
jgi:hypothetical protein